MNRSERRAAAKEARRIDTLNRHGLPVLTDRQRNELQFRSFFTKRRKR